MNLFFVEKFSEGDTDRQLEAMRKYFAFTKLEDAAAIYCASIVMMGQAKNAKLSSGKPLIVYCWDYYLWAHEGKHHNHNWKEYADFLKMADLVIVPSAAQQLRLKELLNIESSIVKTGILTYTHEVSDSGFILDPLRYYPVEEATWAEKAAKELNIPIIHSEHQYSQEEFRKLVASCTFMTCAIPEASTGGLTLSEGLWLGKVSLISDSSYQGAHDYVGPYAYGFKANDYEDFKRMMYILWKERPTIDARKYILKELNFNNMAKELYEAIQKITHRN